MEVENDRVKVSFKVAILYQIATVNSAHLSQQTKGVHGSKISWNDRTRAKLGVTRPYRQQNAVQEQHPRKSGTQITVT